MNWLVTMATALAAAWLTWYLNNLSRPELRFQVSSPIPIDIGASDKTVQQIEIVNVGRASAQSVQVRLTKTPDKIDVIKNSEGDTYKSFTPPAGGAEIVYENLVPDGRLQIITTGSALADSDVQIRDRNGAATLALTSTDTQRSNFSFYTVVIIIFIYIILSTRSGVNWHWSHKSTYSPEDVLRRSRPTLFVSEHDWKSYQDRAIDRLRTSEAYERNPSTWKLTRLLNGEQPAGKSDHEWAQVQGQLNDALLERMTLAMSAGHAFLRIEPLGRLLEFPKPKSMPDDKWQRSMKNVASLYFAVKVEDAVSYSLSLKHLSSMLSEPKPVSIDAQDWESYLNILKTLYYAKLAETLAGSGRPFSDLAKADTTTFDGETAKRIEHFAYKLEMTRLPNVARPYGAEQFLKMPKPDFITDQDYDELIKVAQATQSIEQHTREMMKREHDLGVLTAETEGLKVRVLRQLEIIDAFIADPGILDGLEDYEGAFAPRNLDNLRRLRERAKGEMSKNA